MASTTRTVGRLGVRVIPDSTRFAEDLRKIIQRAELNAEVRIRVSADLEDARRRWEHFRDRIADEGLTANLDLDTGAARLRIAALTRARTIPLNVRVTQSSISAAVTALAALSGARVVGERLSAIGSALANVDRNLPRITAVALAVANLTSVLLSSVAGLLAVAGSLAAVSGAALALPGILAGIGIGVGIMGVALADTSKQLAVLEGPLVRLRNAISGEFWAAARRPILDMARNLLPELRVGAVGVAAALGSWSAQLTGALSTYLDGGVLTGMFEKLAASIEIAAGGTGALAGIMQTLGVLGSEYLPRLAGWFVDVTGKLNEFLGTAAGDGRLVAWMEGGITSGKGLFGVLGNLTEILGSLIEVAGGFDAGGLLALEGALQRVADVMAGPVFQGALTVFFEGAVAGVEALGTALGPIGGMLATLAPSLAAVMTIAGEALAGLLSSVSQALLNPAFSTGLVDLFEGISAGIAAMGPALEPVGGALGALGSVAGTLAESVGGLLGQALQSLAPLLETVLRTVEPLIPILGDALSGAIRVIAPILSQIITNLLPPLVTALADIFVALGPVLQALVPLAPVFGEIAGVVAAVLPILAQLVVGVLQVLASILPPIVNLVSVWAQQFGPLAQGFLELVAAGMPLVTAMLPLLGVLVTELSGVFVEFITAMRPSIPSILELMEAFGEVAVALVPLVTALLPVLTELIRLGVIPAMVAAQTMARGFAQGFSYISGAVQIVIGVVRDFANKLTGMSDTAREAAGSVADVIRNLRGAVEGALTSAGTWLLNAGRSIIGGLVKGITDRISDVRNAVSNVMQAARDFLPNSPAKTGPFSGRGWSLYSGRSIPEALAQGIRDRTGIVREAAFDMAAAAAGLDANAFGGLSGTVKSAVNGQTDAGAAALQVNLNGPMYSYDPHDLLAEARRNARDAAAVAGLRTIAIGG